MRISYLAQDKVGKRASYEEHFHRPLISHRIAASRQLHEVLVGITPSDLESSPKTQHFHHPEGFPRDVGFRGVGLLECHVAVQAGGQHGTKGLPGEFRKRVLGLVAAGRRSVTELE